MAGTSCSSLSLSLGEPLFGTASEASAWLLVEQPGPWGHAALVESPLPLEVGEELQRRAKAFGVKALLVRSPGRSRPPESRCFTGYSAQGAAFLEQVRLAGPADLLGLDLEALAAGRRGHGEPVEGPVYLVCTNGRRDLCCGRAGRPVAAALAKARPGRVFECSHLGGHRFAANVVCLPDGLWYGRVAPAEAEAIASEYERGRLVLSHLRGRSSLSPAAQAADYFVREREGLRGVDDLRLVEESGREVVLHGNGALYRVGLEERTSEPARPTSCRDGKLERPPAWSLLTLAREPR